MAYNVPCKYSHFNELKTKIMNRPDIDNYKDEIHHPNGSIEDVWRRNEYDEDLDKYVNYLEAKLKLLNLHHVDSQGELLCNCSFSESEIDVVESDVVCRTCNKKYVA